MENVDDKGQLNNKGFSLVELIVIMVIMVVLATAVVVSFVNSSNQKVKAATNVVSNYLQDMINYSMTKGTTYFIIRKKGEDYYVENTQGDSEKLQSGIKITYNTVGSREDEAIDIETNNPLVISFSRMNVSFSPIKVETEDKNYVDTNPAVYAEYINIETSNGNGYGKRIHMYTKTGEYKVENKQE